MYYERPREERHPLWVVGGVAGGQTLAHVRLLTVNLLARNVEGQVPDEQDPVAEEQGDTHRGDEGGCLCSQRQSCAFPRKLTPRS